MTAVIHVDQQRGDGLGASQVAQACGLCPPKWGTPISLWQELTGRVTRDENLGQPAQWGQILEPVVRGVYVEQHHVAVEVPERSLYHPALPWLRATPDGIATEPGDAEARRWLVQVKCPGLRQAPHWGTDERRDVPLYYLAQAAVEMAVTGLDRVDFAVLLGGQEYFEVTVHRDLDLEADLLDVARAFWRCVETDVPPPPDQSEAYGRYLATLVNAKSERTLVATPELDAVVSRWRDVYTLLDQLESENDLLKNQLLAAAVRDGAKRIKSSAGTMPVISSTKTTRDWESLARGYGKRLEVDVDADIESHTKRQPVAFVRAPHGWKEH